MKKFVYSLLIILLIPILYIFYLFIPLHYGIDNINNKNFKIEKVGNLKILYLSGTHSEIGYQHGLALKEEISKMRNLLSKELENKNFFEKIVIRYTMKNYFRSIPSEYKKEMSAIAKASGASLDTILLLNIYDELFNLYGCTNVSVWGKKSVDGNIIHGRNLDYFLSDKLWNLNVLFVYNATDGNNFISLTWPGLIGVLTGMNNKGISLGSMTSVSINQQTNGIPTGILYRIIMENAKNISDVENILKANKRTIGNNLMISSKNDKKTVVFEFDSKNLERVESKEWIVSTNHFTTLKNKEEDYSGSISRKIIAEEYLENKQNITLSNIVETMRNLDTGNIGNQSICRSDTVHSAIFLPITGEVYIAANDGIYASLGRYFHFLFKQGKLKYIDYIDYSDEYFSFLNNFFYYKYQVEEMDNKEIMHYIESFTKNRKFDDMDIIKIIQFYKNIDLKEKIYEYIERLKRHFESYQQKIKKMNKDIDPVDRFLLLNHYDASLFFLVEGYKIIGDMENLKKYCEIGINDGIDGESNAWYEMKFKEYYKKYFSHET
ncbi:C45 family autoproteolytic acyltransferase/hydolase [Marinitoga lauensis]|uniref:C45 family autoproteolytic acyltransferase/hydolase n=1 Tax=Marinitoga lauensis TaxID=2201189 RepID=UPI001011D172|nr:C45 family peptidase [Marinitoga lauensis]